MPHRCFIAADVPTELKPVVEGVQVGATALRSDEVRLVPEVLDILRPHLTGAGWSVATGARRKHGIALAATHGPPLRADAVNHTDRAALWVETGRSWTNNGYLEHLVRPTVCPEVEHVAIALREIYTGPAYQRCVDVIDALISSERIGLPYKSVVVVSF